MDVVPRITPEMLHINMNYQSSIILCNAIKIVQKGKRDGYMGNQLRSRYFQQGRVRLPDSTSEMITDTDGTDTSLFGTDFRPSSEEVTLNRDSTDLTKTGSDRRLTDFS